jgi:hypothetical protein
VGAPTKWAFCAEASSDNAVRAMNAPAIRPEFNGPAMVFPLCPVSGASV